MNCDQVKDALVEYLLNELSVEEKSAVDLHLRQGCPSCLACEQELIAGIDVMFDGIASEPLELNQRESILAAAISGSRIQQDGRSIQKSISNTSFQRSHTVLYLLALAAGFLMMMSIAPLGLKNDKIVREIERVERSQTFAVDPSAITHDTELSDARHAKSRLVSMNRANVASMIEGRILWDALSREVHFFGRGIPSPPGGMRYVLWLLGDDEKILTTKELSVNSTGLCKATASNSTGKIRQIFITLESNIGQFDRPSSNVELTLDIKRFDAMSF